MTVENQKNNAENFEKNLREALKKEGALLFELIREKQAEETEASAQKKVVIASSAFCKTSPSVSDLALDSIRRASEDYMHHWSFFLFSFFQATCLASFW